MEQLTANGEDAGKTFNFGVAMPRAIVAEIGVASAPASDGRDAMYAIVGWELRPGGKNLSACPYYAYLENSTAGTKTNALGVQAGYEIKLGGSLSFTPGAAYFTAFSDGQSQASYWMGGSLNINRLSVYGALENTVDSQADPSLRLGVSMNFGRN